MNKEEGENNPEKKQKRNTLLDDILANAIKSTKKVNGVAGLETKKCKSCGAARPSDTNLKICDFCDGEFY